MDRRKVEVTAQGPDQAGALDGRINRQKIASRFGEGNRLIGMV
jgi:hypothetical protein